MGLRDRLIAQVRESGPMSVAQYMTACLHDPADGYYATRPALGADGDFITAPLVSQMFGELIGLWAVACWQAMGRPSPFRLVEIGPGDGTLMDDMLRAARLAPDFVAAADVWLVETSAPLKARQRQVLGDAVTWAASLAEVPDEAPMILVANELLDCLPPRQFVRTDKRWAERVVGLNDAGGLAFGLAGAAIGDLAPDAPAGSVLEQSPAQEALGSEIGARIAADGGAALLIDYGRDQPGFGDTLQALRRHVKESPLASPGAADLTVHADFPAVLAAAAREGAATAPILTQGEFLVRLGIGARAEALTAARPDRSEVIERQLERLVSPDQMGELFKAVCIHTPGLAPPGFEA
ncbi:MAG: class I SAM-dependent methyltransferase [Phenylobacterium sp.]|uniref:class I SAM-dependent methyltransferase n=1 Tax=Phenylobacterium sp. TaxID=1871053 RepID=UPI00271F0B71|nr:class I SAM-dependent methyltransferase [Phenylobacterium sp.]MDO8911972.1 class I SAM-dependent methyltransferase [Phenylobacterium sp.]MDP2009766.1 class I SAM-dependent methyltransferase [Phenylobacterium sp.]MDP3100694.1 class I SAM-dependent methyltransferase [Phenylobacterium sp.]